MRRSKPPGVSVTTMSGMIKPASTFTRSLTGEGRRERMSSLAAATSSTVTPQSCAILGSLFAPSSAKYLRTIVSASGASASSRLSCSSRHSLRSRAATPAGSSPWTAWSSLRYSLSLMCRRALISCGVSLR